MTPLKHALHEARRIATQYRLATVHEAGHSFASIVPAALRILRARARFGVGPVYYSLYRFSRVPAAQWSDYVTDDPRFKQFLQEMSPQEMHRLAKDKVLFHRHCIDHGLATIPILCVVGSAQRTDAAVPYIDNAEQWRSFMADAPRELFVKPTDGTHGEDVFTVTRTADGFGFEGRCGSVDQLFAHLQAKLKNNAALIVQPRLRSHRGMRDIVSTSGLATIRAITCMREGVPKLLIADLKITVGNNIVDNFFRGATGNLVAAIDRDRGTLSAAWGSSSSKWPVMSPYADHPDTGGRIDGYAVPGWNDAVALALRAQASLPRFKTIGWDIAPTDDGPLLVEANGSYDVSILQIAHQRGLRRELMSEFAR